MRQTLVLLLFTLVILGMETATAGDVFRPNGTYDPAVPSPSSVIGHDLGDRPARYDAILRTVEAIAEASPHARLFRYAKSHEGRDLVYLLITSAENQSRLDDIEADITRLADPRGLSESDARELIARTPAVAYMAYSIHGDELSGSDSALRVAYELAAGRDPEAKLLRENLIVLVDPTENPDGRERVLAMSAAYRGRIPNPDPSALVHTTFWPWGRGNHYLFDLNRDWFVQVHPESRGRAELQTRWRPNLVVDAHEMGSQSTYLFSPPRAPFNPNWPTSTRDWWAVFAADQAKAFDRHGWSYYTREWNEEFFPGYGSAMAIYQGAVGILYEQAGNDGEIVRKHHGGTLTYREAVHHQFESSIANLTTAANNREALVQNYHDARREAVERGRDAPARAFYIAPTPDPVRATRLASRLAALGIEVEYLTEAGTLTSARNLWADGDAEVKLPAGSFRVRIDQPDGLLARTILEPHTPMTDAALAEEREYLERDKGSRIYDTTAWSPLLASGLDSYWKKNLDSLDWTMLETTEAPQGRLLDAKHRYGWLIDGSRDDALVAAAQLAARGIRVRVGEKPFTLGETSYPRGSFLVRTEENDEGARAVLAEVADERGIEIHGVDTARITIGPDLGGGHWALLDEPRVAIAAGNSLDFTSVGAAWHLLDRTWGIRVSLIDVARLSGADLDRYNVLVLPNSWGGASAYSRALGESGVEKVREWIERGGTLVGIAGGALFGADEDSDLSKVRARADVLEDFPAVEFGLGQAAIRSLERLQATGLTTNGTSISPAGKYSPESWPAELAIPGEGSPVLGPGTWAMLGDRGDQARKRGAVGPATVDETVKEKKLSDDEKKKARERTDGRLRRFMPSGALLRADLDEDHWLTYGAPDRAAVMVRANDSLIARDPVRTIGRYAAPGDIHLGGLLWPEAVGRLAMTAFLTRERRGRGQIILFADDPNFRGYFWGTERLFLNAVLLGPGVGTSRSIPW